MYRKIEQPTCIVRGNYIVLKNDYPEYGYRKGRLVINPNDTILKAEGWEKVEASEMPKNKPKHESFITRLKRIEEKSND